MWKTAIFPWTSTQERCELSYEEQVEDHLVEEDFLSHAHTCVPTRLRYRERVVKAARNRSFHPEKTLLRYFRLGNSPCGHRAVEKILPAPPTFISLRRTGSRNSEMQELTTGLNELVKHVFLPVREISGR